MQASQISPAGLSQKALAYQKAQVAYKGNKVIQGYLGAKKLTKTASIEALKAGISVRELCGVIQTNVLDLKNYSGLTLKLARHYKDQSQAFLTSNGVQLEKKEKKPPTNYQIEQAKKNWEEKVNKYDAILAKCGLLDKFKASFKPQPEAQIERLKTDLGQATQSFDKAKSVVKKNSEAKGLMDAYKAARKGDPEKSPGLMPDLKTYGPQISKEWPIYQRALQDAGVTPELLDSIKEKIGLTV